MYSKIYLAVVGLLYLVLAIWCSAAPATTSQKVGFELQPGSGQSEYLVIYGGLELGLCLLFLLPLYDKSYLGSSLLACIIIHACLVAFRTISLFVYSDLKPFTYNLAIAEWIILLLALACFLFDKK